jgi:hypothetical protein
LTNSSTYNSSVPFNNQIIFWNSLPDPANGEDWDGFALLVDDVEQYYGMALNFSLAALNASIPHFFRLAVSHNHLKILELCFSVVNSTPVKGKRVTSQKQRSCGQMGPGSTPGLAPHDFYWEIHHNLKDNSFGHGSHENGHLSKCKTFPCA